MSAESVRILFWSDAEILCAKGMLIELKYIIDGCVDVGHFDSFLAPRFLDEA